jgi:hypothetical protein
MFLLFVHASCMPWFVPTNAVDLVRAIRISKPANPTAGSNLSISGPIPSPLRLMDVGTSLWPCVVLVDGTINSCWLCYVGLHHMARAVSQLTPSQPLCLYPLNHRLPNHVASTTSTGPASSTTSIPTSSTTLTEPFQPLHIFDCHVP